MVTCQVCLVAAQKATSTTKTQADATMHATKMADPAAATATAALRAAAEARPAAPSVPLTVAPETVDNPYTDENGDVVGSALIEITRIASMKRKDKPTKADVLELLQNVLQEQRAPLDSQKLNNTDLGKLHLARKSRRTIRKNLSRFRASSLGKSFAGNVSGAVGNNSDNESDYDEVELYAHIDIGNDVPSQPPMVVGFVSAGAGASGADVGAGAGDAAALEMEPACGCHGYDLLSDEPPPVPVVWQGTLDAWRTHMREEHKLWVASPRDQVFSGPVTTAASNRLNATYSGALYDEEPRQASQRAADREEDLYDLAEPYG